MERRERLEFEAAEFFAKDKSDSGRETACLPESLEGGFVSRLRMSKASGRLVSKARRSLLVAPGQEPPRFGYFK